jgi:hypothetical protein
VSALVAAVYQERTVPAVLFHLLFVGVGVVLGGIDVGALLETFRPRGR